MNVQPGGLWAADGEHIAVVSCAGLQHIPNYSQSVDFDRFFLGGEIKFTLRARTIGLRVLVYNIYIHRLCCVYFGKWEHEGREGVEQSETQKPPAAMFCEISRKFWFINYSWTISVFDLTFDVSFVSTDRG